MATIYDDASLYAGNKLGLVNQCLLSIGQRPLSAGTVLETLPLGSDGQIAADVVSNVAREVQNKGWYFNTDRDFVFTPDSFGFIAIPPNLLRVDFGKTVNRGNIVLKGNKFYNRVTRDYVFTSQVIADAIWLMDYETLPLLAFQYIAKRSARVFQQKVLGDMNITKLTMVEEEEALIDLTREDLQYNDYNLIPTSLRVR